MRLPFFRAANAGALSQGRPRAAAFPWIYLLPFLLIEIVFVLWPLVMAGNYSFQNYDFFQASGYIGWDNYAAIFRDPLTLRALWVTFVFTVFSTGLTFFVGFGLAMLLERDGRWSSLMRAVVLVPYCISMLVGSLLLRWIFSEDAGLANLAFQAFGLPPTSILANANTAMAAMVANAIWRDSAFAMLLLLAGLKSIPPSLLWAARVDGGSYWYVFRRVVIPLMQVPIMITLTRLILFYMNILTFPLILTGGGPNGATETIVLRLYRIGFEEYKLGRANALALVLFAVNLLLVALLFFFFRRSRKVA